MSALWELAPPVFLGTLLALVAVMLLTGKHRKLLRGPRRLAAWMYGSSRCSGRRGCMCAGCRGGSWKNRAWNKGHHMMMMHPMAMMKTRAAGGCPMMQAAMKQKA